MARSIAGVARGRVAHDRLERSATRASHCRVAGPQSHRARAPRAARSRPGPSGSMTATSPRTGGTFLFIRRGNTTTRSAMIAGMSSRPMTKPLFMTAARNSRPATSPIRLTLCFMPVLPLAPGRSRWRATPATQRRCAAPSATMRTKTSSSLRRASSMRAGATAAASRAMTTAGSVPGISEIR